MLGLKASFSKEETLAAPVSATTAEVVNSGLRVPVRLVNEKQLTEATFRPSNCVGLWVPCINRDIWDALPKAAREADLSV